MEERAAGACNRHKTALTTRHFQGSPHVRSCPYTFTLLPTSPSSHACAWQPVAPTHSHHPFIAPCSAPRSSMDFTR